VASPTGTPRGDLIEQLDLGETNGVTGATLLDGDVCHDKRSDRE
jgi:hypothetical protein